MTHSSVTPQDVRDQISQVLSVDEQDPRQVPVALERLEQALSLVLDEIEHTVPEASGTVLFSQRRVCAELARALGSEQVPA